MNILCLICARKGSKGIKNKNITKIKNKKLIEITIDQAKKSKLFHNIVVSTDSKKIQNFAISKKVLCWFLRPNTISNDKASKLLALKHGLIESEKKLNKKFDIICDLDVTSPLRKIDDILKAFKKFKKKKYNILFSVNEAKKNPYFNMVEVTKKKISLVKKINQNIVSRQQAPKVYEMNASIYFWKRIYLLKNKSLFGRNIGIYEMPRDRSIDIDDHLDLKIVKHLLKDN